MQLRSTPLCRKPCLAKHSQCKLFTRQLPYHKARKPQRLQIACSIKARWCIDIKYGVKMEAIALLQEWVQVIGSKAGLNFANSCIHSGAVGVPESRLELEVTMGSLSELESFWQQIPAQEHKAWSQRAQHFLIDGSPKWDIYRTVAIPMELTDTPQASTSTPQRAASDSSTAAFDRGAQQATSMGILLDASMPEVEVKEDAADVGEQYRNAVLDWKGEPMKINPGDKMPFNFY